MYAGPTDGAPDLAVDAIDIAVGRLPGMVDLHAHLPQLPNAGLGAGLDLLTWLERYIFPLERGFDEADARSVWRPRPARFRGRRHDDGVRLRRGLRGQP